jgi:hypothetical protein
MTTSKQWARDNYFVSTDPSALQPSAINQAFASEEIVWTKPMDITILQAQLDNSVCFGLYLNHPESSNPTSNPFHPLVISSHASRLHNSNRFSSSNNRPCLFRLLNRRLRPACISEVRFRAMGDQLCSRIS